MFDNVAFPLREHTDLPARLISHIVLSKLHAVGFRGAWRHMPAELSGGMARRVALARAMALDPEILIYDEPFVGLDPISMGVIVRLVRRMNDALGLTSIVVSHDVDEISAVADCSYLLSEGKVAAAGTPEELAENSPAIVRQFMAGMADGPVPFHFPAPGLRGSDSWPRRTLMSVMREAMFSVRGLIEEIGGSTLFFARLIAYSLVQREMTLKRKLDSNVK